MAAVTRLPVNNRKKTGEVAVGPGRETDAHSRSSRWREGVSGNPNGRPVGSKNKNALWLNDLLHEQAEQVVRRVVRAAIDGDMIAARLVFDRILPKSRSRCPLGLAVPALQSAADVCEALGAIAAAVFDGRLSAAEAAELSNFIENYRKALDSASLEERIIQLERRLEENA